MPEIKQTWGRRLEELIGTVIVAVAFIIFAAADRLVGWLRDEEDDF